jgi:metal-responsive CopG/Arc/MetJ family transcriptional regulator
MGNKIIQIPLDEELLNGLNDLSKRRSQSRSALIREACRRYMRKAEDEELDRLYEEGYRRFPETTEFADAQVAVIAEVWGEEETW